MRVEFNKRIVTDKMDDRFTGLYFCTGEDYFSIDGYILTFSEMKYLNDFKETSAIPISYNILFIDMDQLKSKNYVLKEGYKLLLADGLSISNKIKVMNDGTRIKYPELYNLIDIEGIDYETNQLFNPNNLGTIRFYDCIDKRHFMSILDQNCIRVMIHNDGRSNDDTMKAFWNCIDLDINYLILDFEEFTAGDLPISRSSIDFLTLRRLATIYGITVIVTMLIKDEYITNEFKSAAHIRHGEVMYPIFMSEIVLTCKNGVYTIDKNRDTGKIDKKVKITDNIEKLFVEVEE